MWLFGCDPALLRAASRDKQSFIDPSIDPLLITRFIDFAITERIERPLAYPLSEIRSTDTRPSRLSGIA